MNMKYTGCLHKGEIDGVELNRRAIMSVTKRRFTDEDVAAEQWRENLSKVVMEIERKVYNDPTNKEGLEKEPEMDVVIGDVENQKKKKKGKGKKDKIDELEREVAELDGPSERTTGVPGKVLLDISDEDPDVSARDASTTRMLNGPVRSLTKRKKKGRAAPKKSATLANTPAV